MDIIKVIIQKFEHLFTVELAEVFPLKHCFADGKMAVGLKTYS